MWRWDETRYAGSAAHYRPRPPYDRIRALVASYLGLVRRAGRSAELRALLAGASDDGLFCERLHDVVFDVWRPR